MTSASLRALEAIAKVDAAMEMSSGCHYCQRPDLYHPLPGGCTCAQSQRWRTYDRDLIEVRQSIMSGRTHVEYRTCGRILSVR